MRNNLQKTASFHPNLRNNNSSPFKMSGKNKRSQLATPPRKSANKEDMEEEASSPIKSPVKKRVFTGGVDMDEDISNTEEDTMSQKDKEREQRRLVREEQKRTGIKHKKGTGSKKEQPEADEGSGKKTPGTGKKSTSAGTQNDSEGESTVFEQDGKGGKKRINKARRGRSVDSSLSDRKQRGRPRGEGRKTATRGKSVDSSISSRRSSKVGSSDSDSSKGKRKAANETPKSGKFAKFQEGIPNNEGKTASTKKHVRAKKKESYADKATKDVKKNWAYKTIMTFETKVGKCNDVPKEMYKRMASILKTYQTLDGECAIGDCINEKAEPIRSPGEMNWTSHVPFQRHFVLDWQPDWQWDKITGANPRTFRGAFILLSDKDPVELMKFTRVDLRNAFKGIVDIKEMQELHTNVDVIILGVHANTYAPEVAKELRIGLMKAELDLINRKKLFDNNETGISEAVFEDVSYDWENLDFPELLGFRSYPKQGPYEEKKDKEDTSWKLAVHIQMADESSERVDVALAEFIKSGGATALFGSQAIIFRISEMVKGGKEEYHGLVLKHQLTNRSVGSVTLPGCISLDKEVTMFFEPEEEGRVRSFKTVTLRYIINKLYVKIGKRKIPVFLYGFKTSHGQYQFYFWDTVPEIQEFVNLFSRQGAALIWHRCINWGWQPGPLKRLFLESFDPSTSIGAMNSKWCPRKQCAIEIAVTAEAAAFLNFGNSPFILQEGESKDSRKKKKEKGVITRGNLKAGQLGGKEADDLESLGDTSNAETVFRHSQEDDDQDEYDEDDDDISRLSDEDEFDIEQDDDDEHTVNGEADYSSEEEDEEMEEEDEDDDSAFSTKSGLDDLKRSGRQVRRDSDTAYLKRIRELEEEKRLAEERMERRVKEMESIFDANMATVMERLKKKEQELDAVMAKMSVEQEATPEAASKNTKEGSDSPMDSAGGTPAGGA